jgi:GT2 family glycosyltransferase
MDVSIVWLNYNSRPILDLAERSLESVLTLDYDSYEVIIVDNGSTDGSDQYLLSLVNKEKNVKFLKLKENLGYAGGMNEGFKHAKGRFVAFITNDVVAESTSLRQALKYLEPENVACVGGYILDPLDKIFSAGNWVDVLLGVGGICRGLSVGECHTLSETWPVSYVDGAYMICNAQIIRHKIGLPFISETFAYLDDNLLGFKLWNLGYQVLYVPVYLGIHYVSQTFKRLGSFNHLSVKGRLVQLFVINSCKEYIKKIYLTKILTTNYIYKKIYREAIETSNIVRSKFGTLHLRNVPHVHYRDEIFMATIPFYKSVKRRFIGQNTITHDILIIHK